MKNENSHFNCFQEVTFEKAKNEKTGEVEYKFKSIASDDSKDSDGEELDVTGFDYSHLLDYGHVNYNHLAKNNPKSIVGYPTKAEIIDNKFLVEGVLFGDSTLANDIVETSELLKKHGRRPFGISIEGIPLLRDNINSKKIKKAKITNIAITPNPKNRNTVFQLVKGEYNNLYEDYEYEFEKSENPNGSSDPEWLLDIEDKEKGLRVKMDKNLNIKIEKCSNTSDNAGLIKESLEKKPKDLMTFQKAVITLAKAYEEGQVSEEMKGKIVDKIKKNN